VEDHTLYGYTLAEHEYKVTVPMLNRPPSDEPTLIIAISAHGGGTVGQSYSRNAWDYAVYANGTEVISGGNADHELWSGSPSTHADMARTLAGFLSAHAESPGKLAEYDDDARAMLTAETTADRLSLFADGL
jgi:hypothetical protein